ncbi:MAG: MBOAT family protein, partial [Acetatifactor sp.]|nr:MBOAT family protein [Acetatifactor sp.]
LWLEVQVTGFESISTPLAWLAALAYSLELYFDFAGYSLMAVGLGHMLGFRLPENFRQPYMACSVREFYRRWHMTLGDWFCKYVYIPLGGSRNGEGRTVFNLLAVWLLTSLWHGVTANFLIWGMGICLLIILERQVGRLWRSRGGGRPPVICHLYLCVVIPITWMCFAITDLGQLSIYLGRMFGIGEGVAVYAQDWQTALSNYGLLLLAGMAASTPLVRWIYHKLEKRWVGMILLAVCFWFCIHRILVEGGNPFMYRNF